MKFSIIIPVLNEAEQIRTYLTNLQLPGNLSEIILVDGGSSDNTLALAKPFVDILIRSDKGRARQMNAGAKRASGEVLIFLHADTFLPENALKLIQQGIDAGAEWGRFDIQLSGSHPMLKVISKLMNRRSRLTGIATGDQVIFVTRRTFQRIDGFPDIQLMEDIAICKTLKKIGHPWFIHQRVTSSGRRWEQFGIYHTILLMWWLRIGYYFGVHPNTLQQLYSRGLFWKQ